ncbi:MAG: NifB/NifX family molybdenum-iron cluster-binding protein [Verrucomicrobiota bacterium]
MKIAIPITDTHALSAHYGASSGLACYEVDDAERVLLVASVLKPVDGTPCSWPDRLHAEGVTVMLVGGMGTGARTRCQALGIEVIDGMPELPPARLVASYLDGTLQRGESACQPGEHDHPHGHDHAHDGHCHCEH